MLRESRRIHLRLRRRALREDERRFLRSLERPDVEVCAQLARRIAGVPGVAPALGRALRRLERGLDAAQVGPSVAGETRSPDLAPVLRACGWIEYGLGRPLAAMGLFDRALLDDPDQADAWQGLGQSYRALGDELAARRAFGRAARLGPLADLPVAMVGWCHYEAGRFACAERTFRAALRRAPASIEACWGQAWASWRLGATPAVAFARALRLGWHVSAFDLLPILEVRAGEGYSLAALARRALHQAPALALRAAELAFERGAPGAAELMGLASMSLGRPLEIDALAARRPTPANLALRAATDLRRLLARDEREAARARLDATTRLLGHLQLEVAEAEKGRDGRVALARALAGEKPTRRRDGDHFRELASLLWRAEKTGGLSDRERRQVDRLRIDLAEDELARAALRRIVLTCAEKETN